MKQIVLQILVFFPLFSLCQPINIEWQQCYGGSDVDNGFLICTASDGLFILGSTWSVDGDITNNHGEEDLWLIKTDFTGNMIWQKTYGGSRSETPTEMKNTPDGGLIIMAITESDDGDVTGNMGGWDFWVVKLDNQGNIEWERCLGGSGSDYGLDIALSPNSGYICCGRTRSEDGHVTHNNGSGDIWVVKLTLEGIIQWEKTYGGSFIESGNKVMPVDYGYLVFCQVGSLDGDIVCERYSEYSDVMVMAIDTSGNMLWQECYGGTQDDGAIDAVKTSNGGYMFIASTKSNDGDVTGFHGSPGNSYDMWVVKLDGNGVFEWGNCIGGTDDEYPQTILQTLSGSYLAGGYAFSTDGDASCNQTLGGDGLLAGISQSGATDWAACFGGNGPEAIYDVVEIEEGHYVVCALTGTSSNTGNVECNDVDYVDVWVLGIEDTTVGLQEDFTEIMEITAYPNPAYNQVVFSLAKKINPAEKPQITITNALGRQIAAPVLYFMEDRIVWDVREVKRGMYFYQVEAEGEIYVGKVLIQ